MMIFRDLTDIWLKHLVSWKFIHLAHIFSLEFIHLTWPRYVHFTLGLNGMIEFDTGCEPWYI